MFCHLFCAFMLPSPQIISSSFSVKTADLLKTECQRWQDGPYTPWTGMLEIRPTCWKTKLKPYYLKAERWLAREDSPMNNKTREACSLWSVAGVLTAISRLSSVVAYYNRSTKQTAALWLRLTSQNEHQIADTRKSAAVGGNPVFSLKTSAVVVWWNRANDAQTTTQLAEILILYCSLIGSSSHSR